MARMWILCPSWKTCGLFGPSDIKALSFDFKILFHFPTGIQDGRCEPLNPIGGLWRGKKLNVSAHALIQLYNSDCGFYDTKINDDDIRSHQ